MSLRKQELLGGRRLVEHQGLPLGPDLGLLTCHPGIADK